MAVTALGVPPATAADAVVGFSWYPDGARQERPGGHVRHRLRYRRQAHTPFELVITPAGNALPCPRSPALAKLNPNTRVSSGSGTISQTVGTVNLPAGVTVPVNFTVP